MSDRPSLVEVLMRQREAWRKGDRIRVEELLDRYLHLLGQDDAVLDLIYNETVLREQAGEAFTPQEYQRRFPHLEASLRMQFEIEQVLTLDELQHANSPAATPRLPQLAGCEILGEIGRGAMGIVYRGWQGGAQRPVAVKLLSRDVPDCRVRTEAEAASRLQHPNIVQVFEVKEFDGRTALVLEYVEGGTLAQKLAGKPQPPRDIARLVETLAQAMAYAHGRGVIHRDLKPTNVLLSAGADEPLRVCTPKISDFGLAKFVEGGERLTATNDILGTPGYMAPEQTGSQSSAVGPECDTYSLGAILYEGLTGRPPFLGESVLDTMEQVRNQDPVPPSRLQPRIPRDLETICLKCLHKVPSRRYGSTGELAEDLRRYLAGEPIHGRAVGLGERALKWARRRPAGAALVLVSVAALTTLIAGAIALNQALRRQRDLARDHAEQVEQQLERTRRLLYTAQLLRVGSVWEGDPGQGLRMLEDPSACPPDLRCLSWAILHGQCKRYRLAIGGLDATPTAVAHYPRGRLLVSGHASGSLRLWDTATGQETSRLQPHAGSVTALAFSVDGTLLASASADGVVRLWDMPAGVPRGQIEFAGRVGGLAWPADGKTLAVADGKEVTLWDARTRRARRKLVGEVHPLSGVAFSPDAQVVAAGAPDSTVRLWDAKTGRPRGQLRGHSSPVTGLVFAHGGRHLVTGGLDSTLRVWDIGREAELRHVDVATGPVAGMALHPGGEVVAVAGAGTGDSESAPDVQLWNLDGRGYDPLRGHLGATCVAFAPDGKALVSAGTDRTIKLWDHPGPREQLTLRGHSGTPGSVAVSRDGQSLAWVGKGTEVGVVDLVSGELLNSFRSQGRPIQAVALSPDGARLASATGHPDEPAELLVWDVRTGRLVQALSGHAGTVVGLTFNGDGRLLASAGRDGPVKVWDVAAGKARHQLDAGQRPLRAIAWSGNHVAVIGPALVVWNATTGQVVHRVPTSNAMTCLALSSKSGLAVMGGEGNQVRLFDLHDGTERAVIPVGMKGVASLAFSADEQALAVAGAAGGVKLWDVPTVQERASLPGHRGGVMFAGFSDDGRLLVTVSLAQSARLWHAAPQQ